LELFATEESWLELEFEPYVWLALLLPGDDDEPLRLEELDDGLVDAPMVLLLSLLDSLRELVLLLWPERSAEPESELLLLCGYVLALPVEELELEGEADMLELALLVLALLFVL
jgi:hypothetical protein